jgi:tetratricopeptide (TPR) repeat protein
MRTGPQGPVLFLSDPVRRAMVWTIAVKLAVVALVFDPRALNAFAVVKAQAAYAFSTVLVLGGAYLVARYRAQALKPSPVHLAATAVLIAYLAATLFALNPAVAILGAPDRGLGLLTLLDGVVLFAAVTIAARTARDAYVIGAGLFAPIVPVTAYAILQLVGRDPLTWRFGERIVFSTFGNSGVLSQYAGTLTVSAAVLAALPGIAPTPVRWVLGALALIGLAAVLASGTGAALIGLGVAIALAGPVVVMRAIPAGRRRPILRGYALAAALAAVALALTPQARDVAGSVATLVRTAGRPGAEVGSDQARLALYSVSIAEILERPILGVGPDNFTVAFGPHRTADLRRVTGSEAVETSTHSWLLHVLTDAGIVGLVTLVATIAFAIQAVMRRGARPVGLAALAGLAFFLSAGLVAVNDSGTDWLLWLAIGVCARSGARSSEPLEQAPVQAGHAGRRNLAAAGAIVAVSLVAMVPQASVAIAGDLAGQAIGLRLAGDARTAVRLAQDATARAPFRAEYWHELGLGHADLGDLRAAAAAFERAVELAPYHSTYLSNLARAYVTLAQSGDRAALASAIRTADRAIAADPNSSLVHVTRGLVLITAQRAQEALNEILFVRTLDPDMPFTAYQVEARAHLALGQAVEAIRAVDDGLVRGRDQDLGMMLVRVQADLALGRRADAANDIVRARRFDRSDAIVRDLQRSFVAADVEGVLSAESFQGIPAWLADGKDPVGRIAGNVFTASKPSWRVVAVPIPTGDVRISVQFRFPGPQRESDEYFFEMGRVSETEPAVSLAQFRSGPFTRIMRTVGAETSVLASGAWAGTKTNTWYWLEIEFRGSQVTGTLYESGAQPQPKVSAQVLGAVSADLGFASRSGSFFFSGRSAPGVQIGGIPSATGGFYVERLKPSAQ